MATNANATVEIKLTREQRERLGKDFKSWIERVEDSRRERMKETWILALDNWEGKVPTKTFPWIGASNAHLPVTGTHTNAIKARLAEASTAQDPNHLILPSAGGFMLETPEGEVTYELWARWWANISKWIEKTQIPMKALMQENALTVATYGDSFIYTPWERQLTTDVSMDLDTGEAVFTERVLLEGPNPSVIHGKDIYIEFGEKGVQKARTVGMGFDLDLPTLREWVNAGTYDKEIAEKMETRLSDLNRENRQSEELGISEHKEWGADFDMLEQEKRRRVGISDTGGPNALRMIRVWSRADLNDDGVPEEVIFEVDKETGLVPYARYADSLHRQRPLDQFIYDKRPGSIMNRGVPELLFNLQKIIDTTMRDHLDNNKIQNTKMFLAKKGSPVEEDARVYPSRVMFVDNTDPRAGDLVPIDMGSGRPVTQIADIGLLERHAQFITGLSDQNLGNEKRSRTPATTTLALIEEGNKGLSEKIDVWREAQQGWWKKVLMLYFQHGDPNQLVKVAVTTSGGPESTEEVLQGLNPHEEERLFLAAWATADPAELFNQISLTAQVSSNALNRSMVRQEAMALFAQFDQFATKMIEMANMIGGSIADPNMRTMLMFFVKGYRRAMARVLDTMDVKDQEIFIPEQLENIIEQVNSVPAGPTGSGGANGSSPAQQAQGLAGQPDGVTNPGESPGRPVAGGGRSAGELVSTQ